MRVQGVIISGPPGSGKTTLAEALSAHVTPSVHLLTDWFYSSIKTGFIEPWLAAAHEQNTTVVRAAAQAAAEYARGGYFVLVDGVVLPWAREIYETAMRDVGCELDFLVLLPGAAEAARRGRSRREGHGLTAEVYFEMHRQFEATFSRDEIVESDGVSVDQLLAITKRRLGLGG